jgi:hypothetical protein
MLKKSNILPHKRTCRMISVDPEAALQSSLQQLGSGTVITDPILLKKFKKLLTTKRRSSKRALKKEKRYVKR